jgi:hypothetical protein
MKLIEALKKVKDLQKKADDLKEKICKHCADLDVETPVYSDQKNQVESWMQSHHDTVKEIGRLNYCILKTNVNTRISIELGGKLIEKSLSEWMLRKNKLCQMEESLWKSIGDKNLREGSMPQTNGMAIQVKIRRYYDPKMRDEKLSLLMSEPSTIDGKIEIANCITDLME